MSAPRAADIGALLAALQDADVEFCVIGGVAAVAHGATTPTRGSSRRSLPIGPCTPRAASSA